MLRDQDSPGEIERFTEIALPESEDFGIGDGGEAVIKDHLVELFSRTTRCRHVAESNEIIRSDESLRSAGEHQGTCPSKA